MGTREASAARAFIADLAGRIREGERPQMTTDGLRWYLDAVEMAFGEDVDYALLHKQYSRQQPTNDSRYSPPRMVSIHKEAIKGSPDPTHISTSYVERQNFTMRMHMRRFTRLTNASSKKLENHTAAIALHFMFYNFCRVHKTLRVTPAMEAGLAAHVWSLEEIVGLLGAAEKKAA